MPVNLGSNKTPYKTGPDGKLIPNPPERAGPTPLTSGNTYQDRKPVILSTGGNKQQRDAEILRYPLDRQDAYPASITFEPYIVDAYKVTTDGLKEVMDAPLLKKFLRTAANAAAAVTTTSSAELNSFGGPGAPIVTKSVNPDTGIVYDEFGDRVISAEEQEKAELAERAAQIEQNQNEMGDKLTDLRAYRDPKAPTLILYLPPGLQYQDAVNYNDPSLGPAGLSALAGINSRQSIMSSLGKGLSEGLESIFDLARGAVSGEAARLVASRAANLIPSEGLSAAVQLGVQAGLNPGTRMLFDKPNVRRFTFSFKLIATSPQEATQIEQIVKEFREQAYPEEIDINNIPVGYQFPNVFRISMKFGATGASPHMPRLQYCYLETISTTYNGTADVFYADGHPTEVDLTLQFVEYRPLSKRDVKAGF